MFITAEDKVTDKHIMALCCVSLSLYLSAWRFVHCLPILAFLFVQQDREQRYKHAKHGTVLWCFMSTLERMAFRARLAVSGSLSLFLSAHPGRHRFVRQDCFRGAAAAYAFPARNLGFLQV
jgi:type IV secretory pathway TraG/TraD family ATPase VirD4